MSAAFSARVWKALKPALFAAALTTGAIWAYTKHVPYSLGWNTTASIPLGIYGAKNYAGEVLKRGDIVCFKFVAPNWAVDRGYAAPGQRLCKPIAALPGDQLRVDTGTVTVLAEGREPTTLKLLLTDSKSRPMPQNSLTSGVILPGQVLLISDYNAKSLDSRYLGLIALSNVTDQIWPLLVKD